LEEKVAAPVYKTENAAVGIRRADHVAPLYPQKLALTLPTSGGHLVGIVRSRAETTGFSSVLVYFFLERVPFPINLPVPENLNPNELNPEESVFGDIMLSSVESPEDGGDTFL
jgi:hypothetical protein